MDELITGILNFYGCIKALAGKEKPNQLCFTSVAERGPTFMGRRG